MYIENGDSLAVNIYAMLMVALIRVSQLLTDRYLFNLFHRYSDETHNFVQVTVIAMEIERNIAMS